MNLPRPVWRTKTGPDADVVVSTRCRVARNLPDIPFPWRASPADRRRVADAALRGLAECGAPWSPFAILRLEDLDRKSLRALADERYTTREWAAGAGGQALAVSRDSPLSVLLNEEDHLRFQCLLPGLQVRRAFRIVADAVERLGARLSFAWSEEFGFLTASPVNVGSGLRVSVWMHVPALASDGRLQSVLDAAAELGSSVRGAHGEGTSGTGELFQLSNTWSDSRSAERAAERLSAAAAYVVEEERAARAVQFGGPQGRAALHEAAHEALKLIAREDATPRRLLQLVSVLRLAVAEGVLPGRLRETAHWLAVAGGADTEGADAAMEAVERSEALRRLLARMAVRG